MKVLHEGISYFWKVQILVKNHTIELLISDFASLNVLLSTISTAPEKVLIEKLGD